MMALVEAGQITVKMAGERLGVSYRQAKRIRCAYKSGGDAAMVHGNSGKTSVRKIDEKTRKNALDAYRERYWDFGPTLASEYLAEHEHISVSVETLRKWLIAEGLWVRHRKRCEHRQRRERKPHFGDMVQFDGSLHAWFEKRGVKCCLMNMVDDATGKTYAQFFEEETIDGAMRTLWRWIEQYGIPKALYCDKKNAFLLTREPTDAELLKGITKPKSYFGIACEKLGIEVIAANTPQAKGRVERNHQVYQDRFVKELRLEHISTIEEANMFLEKTYLPEINAKFEKPPLETDDGHVPLFSDSQREQKQTAPTGQGCRANLFGWCAGYSLAGQKAPC
ncbi:MAG: ISNCY-like element ISTde1 family transposase [Treponemataceae bacterium]|nr:MAG: ISNCY-like element ISTde1 family transposase [Treponemataceae bacterium]